MIQSMSVVKSRKFASMTSRIQLPMLAIVVGIGTAFVLATGAVSVCTLVGLRGQQELREFVITAKVTWDDKPKGPASISAVWRDNVFSFHEVSEGLYKARALTLSGKKPSKIQVRVVAPGIASKDFELSEPRNHKGKIELDIDLRPSQRYLKSLHGFVINAKNSKPIPNFRFTFNIGNYGPYEVTTNNSGVFEISQTRHSRTFALRQDSPRYTLRIRQNGRSEIKVGSVNGHRMDIVYRAAQSSDCQCSK